jgi:hypothetical protein
MELYVVRFCLADSFTIGYHSIGNDRYFLLEDKVREVVGQPVASWKIPKQTAIPFGRYRMVIDQSARLGRETPHLLDVSGFDGIRIHRGNTAADTEGCPIIGLQANVLAGVVSQSTAAESAYLDKVRSILAVEPCYVTFKMAA